MLSGIHENLFGGSRTERGFMDPAQAPYLDFIRSQGQGIAEGQLGQIGPYAQQLSGGLMGQANQFMQGMGQNAGQQLNPFISGSSLQPQLQGLAEVGQQFLGRGLGQIGGGALQSGGYGGTRQGVAEGQAIGDATGQFMGAAGSLIGQDMMRRQSAAMGQAGLQQQSALGGMSQMGNLYNLGMSPFSAEFAPLQNMLTSGGLQNSQLAGGSRIHQGGWEAIQAGIMASDRRLKRDIVPLGESGGHQWYEFKYLWDDIKHVGVMAQDLLEYLPGAVIERPDGFLMVDYGRL